MMNSKYIFLTTFFVCCCMFLVISKIYTSEALYYYHMLLNGTNINDKIELNDEFVITETRKDYVFIIRNLGHQKEQIAVVDKIKWSFDYESALRTNQIEKLSTENANCIAYKRMVGANKIPEYSYYFPNLEMYLLIFKGVHHTKQDINKFCSALKVKRN